MSDAGVKHLIGLANLRHFELNNTQISDAGLTHLGGLTDLVGLSLGDTRVSNAGRKKLTNTLPRVRIYP